MAVALARPCRALQKSVVFAESGQCVPQMVQHMAVVRNLGSCMHADGTCTELPLTAILALHQACPA